MDPSLPSCFCHHVLSHNHRDNKTTGNASAASADFRKSPGTKTAELSTLLLYLGLPTLGDISSPGMSWCYWVVDFWDWQWTWKAQSLLTLLLEDENWVKRLLQGAGGRARAGLQVSWGFLLYHDISKISLLLSALYKQIPKCPRNTLVYLPLIPLCKEAETQKLNVQRDSMTPSICLALKAGMGTWPSPPHTILADSFPPSPEHWIHTVLKMPIPSTVLFHFSKTFKTQPISYSPQPSNRQNSTSITKDFWFMDTIHTQATGITLYGP